MANNPLERQSGAWLRGSTPVAIYTGGLGYIIGVQRSIRIPSRLRWPRVVVRIVFVRCRRMPPGNRVSYHVQRLCLNSETR